MSKYDKLDVSDDEALSFIKPAVYVVDTEYTALDEDERTRAVMEVSTNMAAGSAWTKRKYLLIGGVVGALYLAAGLLGYSFGKGGKES